MPANGSTSASCKRLRAHAARETLHARNIGGLLIGWDRTVEGIQCEVWSTVVQKRQRLHRVVTLETNQGVVGNGPGEPPRASPHERPVVQGVYKAQARLII